MGGRWPAAETRPGVGFNPAMPVQCAGTRIDPPPSLPIPPRRTEAREGRRFSAARPAGRSLQVPRVICAADDVVVGFVVAEELRAVRFSQRDRAGLAQPAHGRGVLCGAQVAEEPAAACGGQTGHVVAVLDGDRDAVQRPDLVARHEPPLRVLRARPRFIGQHQDEGVQAGVVLLDVRQVRINQLDRR